MIVSFFKPVEIVAFPRYINACCVGGDLPGRVTSDILAEAK